LNCFENKSRNNNWHYDFFHQSNYLEKVPKDNNNNKKNVQIQYIDNRWPDEKKNQKETKKETTKKKEK
tara:strand:- start:1360 stop:1563 length:204 start_codon:yes stop_codon:yes gene_type:complete